MKFLADAKTDKVLGVHIIGQVCICVACVVCEILAASTVFYTATFFLDSIHFIRDINLFFFVFIRFILCLFSCGTLLFFIVLL